MTMEITTLRLPEQLLQSVREAVEESKRREDVPDMKQSEILREAVEAGLGKDVLDLIPEEQRILLERSRFMDVEGKVSNLRSGFRTKVSRAFKRRFENGFDPDELAQFRENMVRECYLLWPEWSERDYEEERTEAIRYVDSVCVEAQEAARKSDVDPLDPERLFEQYEGVERGREEEQATTEEQRIEAEISEAVERGVSREFILSNAPGKLGVPRDRVETVLDQLVATDGGESR